MRSRPSLIASSVGLSLGFLCAIAASTGIAETLPTKGKVDSRIRTTLYSAEDVYRLYGFVGYDIELIFEPGERFAGKGGGDLEGVTIEAHENQVHIKPRAAVVATNLVIYTDRRAYRFDYSADARKPDPITDEVMYAVRFTYPAEDDSEARAKRMDAQLNQRAVAGGRNMDYWFCGHRAVRPIAASDDGVHTRLTFSPRAEIPALFVLNDDGIESLLNFSMEGADVVIHQRPPSRS